MRDEVKLPHQSGPPATQRVALPAQRVSHQVEGSKECGVPSGKPLRAETARLMQGIFLQQARKGATFLARVLRRLGDIALMGG